MNAPLPSPAEQAVIDRSGIFAEERVVEEVARAMWADQYPFDHWDSTQRGQRDHYRRLAAAAVAAYRAQDGGAEEAASAKKVVRCGRGYTDAEHWIDGYYACPGFASPALAPQAGDGAR